MNVIQGFAFLSDDPVLKALEEQVSEELGNQYTRTEQKMAQQKFGLIPPQLTGSEKNLIICEERYGTDFVNRERRR